MNTALTHSCKKQSGSQYNSCKAACWCAGKKALLMLLIFFSTAANAQLQYYKQYSTSNILLSEGWLQNGTKVKYWKFYTPEGKLKEEGHFTAGKKSGYWYFYNGNGIKTAEGSFANDEKTKWWKFYVNGKKESAVQYSNNLRNGYCLRYSNGDVYKCEKYKNDNKTGEWTDMAAFRRDNPDF
jgi:antitoxin component YwqK of YwqJK toxin-antitoxin module